MFVSLFRSWKTLLGCARFGASWPSYTTTGRLCLNVNEERVWVGLRATADVVKSPGAA